MSFGNETNQTSQQISLEERVANVVAVLPIVMTGLFGNALVLAVVAKGLNRRQRSKSNAFVFLLAICDLVFLLSSAVPNVARYISGSRSWLFPEWTCPFLVFLSFASANAGCIVIACFSTVRLLAVRKPHCFVSHLTFKTQMSILLPTMFIPIAYSSIWLINIGVKRGECTFIQNRGSYLLIFVADFAAFFAFPLMITCIAAIYLIRIIATSTNHMPRRARDGHIATKIMVTVAVTFAITCLPYRTIVIWNSLKGTNASTVWLTHVCRWLWYANSAINPICYSFCSEQFRRGCFVLLAIDCLLPKAKSQPGSAEPNKTEPTRPEDQVVLSDFISDYVLIKAKRPSSKIRKSTGEDNTI